MDGSRHWWTHWPLIVLIGSIVVFGAALWVVDPASSTGRSVAVLWGAVPAAMALWQYSYTHIERHRLWVNRLQMTVTNPEVAWGLEVEYDLPPGASGPDALKASVTAARALMHPTDSVLSDGARSFVTQLQGVTVRITLESAVELDGETAILRLDIPVTQRGFRGWRTSIDQQVPRLLENVEHAVRPVKSKFSIDVGFANGNPYFGLFVKKVPEAQLVRFDVEYFEHSDKTGAVIRVNADRVRIVTESLQSSRTLSLHYLALRPAGAHP